MKKVMKIILVWFGIIPSFAQTVVKDAFNGNPVAFASVFNQKGDFLGMTTTTGALPAIGNYTSIRIQHIAYEPLITEISQQPSELVMTPIVVPVGEVVVNKPKSHCLKLTGYFRELRMNVDTTGQKPPIDEYEHGIMHIYLFNDGTKSKHLWSSICFELSSTVGLGAPISLGNTSLIEYIRRNKGYQTEDRRGYSAVYKDNNRVGTLIVDSATHTIRLDYDEMAPDTIHEGHVFLFKYILKEAKVSLVYRMTPYERVSQSSLLSYHYSTRCWLKALGKVYDQWSFSEFFPYKAEYLTKAEYKKDRKAVKESRRESMTSEQLISFAREKGIPSLSPELCQQIELSKKMKR